MNQGTTKKTTTYAFATITMAILASSALFAPTFSAYTDNGDDKDKSHGDNDNNQSHGDHDDHHKKGKKDPDKDKDNNGKHEGCEEGQHLGNDKYKKECDSDHDFKK